MFTKATSLKDFSEQLLPLSITTQAVGAMGAYVVNLFISDKRHQVSIHGARTGLAAFQITAFSVYNLLLKIGIPMHIATVGAGVIGAVAGKIGYDVQADYTRDHDADAFKFNAFLFLINIALHAKSHPKAQP